MSLLERLLRDEVGVFLLFCWSLSILGLVLFVLDRLLPSHGC